MKKPVTKSEVFQLLYMKAKITKRKALQMKKKLMAMVLSLVATLLFMCTVAAASPHVTGEKKLSNDKGVKLTLISSTLTNLVIDTTGKASCATRIDAYDGVDSVTISAYLQRYDNGWKAVKQWSESSTGTYFVMQKTKYVTQGYLYRLRAYYYAYDGDDYESVNDTVYWDY